MARVAKKLAMDLASRMKRAREMGFNPNQRLYHGSSNVAGPAEAVDLSIGGVPLYRRGQPVDYSPHQFTQNPTARDYARANVQEDMLINQWRLDEAYEKGGTPALQEQARLMLKEQIESYKDDWPELVPELERMLKRVGVAPDNIKYQGGYQPQGIESFNPDAFEDGLYGRGVYMTDSPTIAGGGEGNDIAELGYATPRTQGVGAPTVYPLMARVENPWLPDSAKFKKKDIPKDMLAELEDYFYSSGKNPKGKWPMSDSALRSYMGNEWTNNLLRGMGYDGIRHKGGQITGAPEHSVTIAFDPSQVRSVNAAFDPAKAGSSDLLAGIGGLAPIAGGAALMAPTKQAQAGMVNPYSPTQIGTALLQRGGPMMQQEAIPAKFPALHSIANLIGGIQDPTGLALDTSGTADYLRNFGEGNPSFLRALGAMPF